MKVSEHRHRDRAIVTAFTVQIAASPRRLRHTVLTTTDGSVLPRSFGATPDENREAFDVMSSQIGCKSRLETCCCAVRHQIKADTVGI